jgi:uncharacterized protein
MAIETRSKIISWNYRGYGNSSGKSSFKTQFDDNRLIFEQLNCKEDQKPLVVIGYSLGSFFATDLAVKNTIDKLVLLATVSDISDMLVHYKKQILNGPKAVMRPFINLKIKEEFVLSISNTDKIKAFYGDLLILQAKDDEDLPYSMGKKLYEVSPSKNKLFIGLKKGGHAAPLDDKNWDSIINWLK